MSNIIEDVDIQAEKQKYLAFRKRMIYGIIFSTVFALFWPKYTGAPHGLVATFAYLFTPWGWPVFISVGGMFWFFIRWRNYHFRCPHPDCDEAIYLAHDWVCFVDKSTTEYPWTLWYTIFTGCRKHGHLSPAHRCPNKECNYVFKLVENARTGLNKFSYRPDPAPQPVQQLPQVKEDDYFNR
jgi:hypothetical protein